MTISIRTYEPADLDACRGLWVELTQKHRDLYNADDIGGDDPAAEFNEHLAKVGADNIFVADEDGVIVGFAGLIPGDLPELEPIVVASRARGRGVGQALVARVFEVATERGTNRIVVRPVGRNTDALRFFREAGFRTLGQVEILAYPGGGPSWGRPGANISGTDFDV